MILPMHVGNFQVIVDGNMSADIVSSEVESNELTTVAIQAVWTGSSPSGNLVVQGTCDGTNFTQISSDAVSGDSGSILKNMTGIGYSAIRVFYDVTSGSGTLNVTINAKR